MKMFASVSRISLRALIALLSVVALAAIFTGAASADLAACASATGGVSGTGPGQNIKGAIGVTNYDIWAGVIYVDLTGTPNDVQAFCIDLTHHINIGDCFNTGAALTGDLAKTIYYYPPDKTQSNDENAARQAVVWHFSDGFVPTSPAAIVTRYNAILADLAIKPAPPSSHPPTLTVNPASATKYIYGSQAFTFTLLQDGAPMPGQTITLSLNGVGSLSAPSIVTDANGEATVTVTSNDVGVSQVVANFAYTLPQGTQFNPVVADKQKLVLGETTTGNVTQDPSVQWQKPTAVTLTTFNVKIKNKSVQAHWKTDNEMAVTGFNVWRRVGKNEWKKLNADTLAPTHTGVMQGAKYNFNDKTVKSGKTYWYKIEVVGVNGTLEWSEAKRIVFQ